jgi:uncharacterized membrane protein YedE/YeeE
MDHLFPLSMLHYLAGGSLIGLAGSLLFVTTGRIGGMSTVFSSTWSYFSNLPFFRQERFLASREWRLVYALGLILGALAFSLALGHGLFVQTGVAWWQLAIGGFVAGFGARMSGGCTSGHGICGLASLQLPSLLAVITFLATAMVTANIVLALGGA